MTDTPLNPEALEAMSRQIDPDWWQIIDNYPGDIAMPRYRKTVLDKAERYARAYLTAAVPETRCVERHSPDLVCDGCEPPTPAQPEVTEIEALIEAAAAGRKAKWEAIKREVCNNGVTEFSEQMQVELDWYLADQMVRLIELHQGKEASNE